MNDVQPETVKVGLIRTVEAVRAIAEALTKYRPRHIVYAPSSQSSQGEALIPADVELAINQLLLPTCTVVLSDARFKSHGDINLYASAVAYYLNEGDNAEDAQRKARQFLNVQRAHAERLLSRGFELFDEFRQMVEAHFVEIRTKGEPGTGDVVQAVSHIRLMQSEIRRLVSMSEDELFEWGCGYAFRRRPDDAAEGAEGVFVGSGIFKSGNPAKRAAAIVKAVTNYNDAKMPSRTLRGFGRSNGGH